MNIEQPKSDKGHCLICKMVSVHSNFPFSYHGTPLHQMHDEHVCKLHVPEASYVDPEASYIDEVFKAITKAALRQEKSDESD